jgi:hypothetical protein
MPTATSLEVILLSWAVVLLSALVVGCIVGSLTFAQTKGSWPAALLAALAAGGATILGAHQLLL